LNNGGTVTLTDVEISANTATAGGGIFNAEFGTVTITNSTLSENEGRGGGIRNDGEVTITNSRLVDNNAPLRFGGRCGAIDNNGLVTIANSTLLGNRANDFGGGICNSGEGAVRITNSTLSGNTAGDNFGGGIDNSGTVTITNSTLSGNVAENGGGISNNEGGTVRITNSTLSGNKACFASTSGGCQLNQPPLPISRGGGIFNSGTVIITNSTLSGNVAKDDGNSLLNRGRVTITNSIVANPPGTENCSGPGTITDRGVNLDSGPAQLPDARKCGFSLSGDPLLDPGELRNNGGPTETIALCTGMGTPMGCLRRSPAIDAGNICGVAPNNIDQRGFVRPVGGTCDIGAFESGAELPPVINNSLVNIVQRPRTLSPDTTGCPSGQGFVGKSSVSYRLTNKSTSPVLYDLMAKVTMLEDGDLLQNADGVPSGMGAILTVPKIGQYSDGLLSRGQFVDVFFVICLKDLSPTFLFDVEWRGLTR
jgi:Right handed beta helix region